MRPKGHKSENAEMSRMGDKKKGPAEAATSPSHGPIQTLPKDQNMNKSTNTTAASEAATPIISLAIRAEQSIALFDKAEVVGRVSQGTKEALSLKSLTQAAAQHLNDEDMILRGMITLHKAQCMDDAAVQLSHASIYLDMLWDQFPNEDRDSRVREDYRALLRLLHSVRDYVEGAVSQQRIAPFTAVHTNPWSHIETVKNYEVSA